MMDHDCRKRDKVLALDLANIENSGGPNPFIFNFH